MIKKEKVAVDIVSQNFECVNCGHVAEDIKNPACPIACPKCHAGRMIEVYDE